jgi:hypothetical protein
MQPYFLVGTHYALPIGEFENLSEATNSRYYQDTLRACHNDSIIVNHAEAHEIMRQLVINLKKYDNTEFKQTGLNHE